MVPTARCFAALATISAGVVPTVPVHAQLGAIIDGLLRPPPPPYYRPPPPPPPDYPGAYTPGYAPPAYRAPPRRQAARSDPTVAEAQRTLTDLGYQPGPVDGSPGPRLTEAIRAFQGDHGQTRDGRLGPETLAAMRAAAHERTRSAGKPQPHEEAAEVTPAPGRSPPVDNIEDIPAKLR